MKEIRRCCSNTPFYFITYNIGSQFHVCSSCILLKHWSRGIKEKIPISEIIGQGRPQTKSEVEVIDG